MFLPLIAVFSLMQEPNALPDAVQVQFQLPAERIVEYPASELRQISAPVLSETAQEAFDNSFLVASHYSAFAYSKDGGFGYSTTANTQDAARQIAMQQCLNFNEQCRIIAEIIPVGYRPPGPGDITVSPVIADLIRDARSQPQFRAMAISEEGAYSYVWGHKNQENANRAAIADCDSHIDPNLLGTSIGVCILVPGVGF